MASPYFNFPIQKNEKVILGIILACMPSKYKAYATKKVGEYNKQHIPPNLSV